MEKKENKVIGWKKYRIIVVAAVGVALMLLPKLFFDKESKETDEKAPTEVVYYSEKLEDKIKDLICASLGVGNAKVVVTLDGTGEYVYAQNEKKEEGAYVLDYVILNTDSGEEAVIVSEIYPKVRGVAIVCDGGENAKIKEKVTTLVAAALGISASKIAVSG